MNADRKPSTLGDYLKSAPETRERALDDLRLKLPSLIPDALPMTPVRKLIEACPRRQTNQ
jgi:hypothetical protein